MSVLIVAGTRPEIIKLLPVALAMRERRGDAMRFCHSGQHAEMGRDLLDAAGILPEEALDRPAGNDIGRLLSGMITTIGAAIDRQDPKAVVVQGDTATTLAASLAAYHRHIPIAHVEAGLRSGNLARPWPEEGYRRMVTPITRWHFAPTEAAATALRCENVAEGAIETVGNTVIDALHWACARLDADSALGTAAGSLIEGAQGRPIVLATVHRREADETAMRRIAAGLLSLVESEGVQLILPLHPRSESAPLRERLGGVPRVTLTDPLDYFAFVRLMRAARLIVSDSGGIQEEATALGRPVLVLRDVTERREAIAAGSARLVGYDAEALLAGARWELSRPMPTPSTVFGDGRAAGRIADRILNDISGDLNLAP
ncbi:non-hydrolyzing UDP-N-acetylglucosamine 2-epimerase [Croceicoccus naphthovorans]|uniref:non-hydrolyzing UDP-N-acetylglucosamine 2-epimerase n=1 Tax=Croceicoccus naphthovorans TaxID=1348774 RepID=UPI000A8DD150|nr:UDP-N-acetylglucosamine 2-epimerase (non-hydrolyzing) [Croceicoccus naphthovorans]MBB3989894.1 UDP-N-acetylglucosamine 2-epimerase (non-hydrolyzing) [Croceicoccus naphthovorans]